MDDFNKISGKIRDLVESGRLDIGLDTFKTLVEDIDGEWRDLASSLLNRYESLHLDRIDNLITKEKMDVGIANLVNNLLAVVRRLEKHTDCHAAILEKYERVKITSSTIRYKHLLSGLIAEMGCYNKDVLDWYENVQEKSEDWVNDCGLFDNTVEELLDKSNGLFKQILSRIFREQKNEKEYAQFFLQVPNQLIEILCFALLSRLRDEIAKKNVDFTLEEKESIIKFFKRRLEDGLGENAQFLKHLLSIFSNNDLRFPIGELADLSKNIKEKKSPFLMACKELLAIIDEFTAADDANSRCEKAEKPITIILKNLCFLSMYSLASVRRIEPDKYRSISKGYLHRYFDLYGNSMEFEYMDKVSCNDAVLMFKNDMQDSVNIGPFLFDANSYCEGAKLDIETYKSSGGENKLVYSIFDWLSKTEDNRSRVLIYRELPEMEKGNVADMYPSEESVKQKKINDLYLHLCLIKEDFLDAFEKE